MARRYYSSTARRTTLAADINSSVTSLTVAAVSGWPSSFPYTLVLDEGTLSEELVEVSARSGTTVTVTRGVDGTSAVAHTAGATVNHGVSARDFNEPNQFLNEGGTVTGATVVEANSSSAALRITQTGSGNALVVEDSASTDFTPFIVDASGSVGVGTSTPSYSLDVVGSGIGHTRTAAIPQIVARRQNAGNTIVASGDQVLDVIGQGYDGAAHIAAARIRFEIDGTPGTNDMPGRLVFSTTADGASTPTERMRITSAGRVGIGDASPSVRLQISGTDSDASIRLNRYSTDTSSGSFDFIKIRGTLASPTTYASGDTMGSIFFRGFNGSALPNAAAISAVAEGTVSSTSSAGRLAFFTTADGSTSLTERMRITSAGNVGIGTSSPGYPLDVVSNSSTQGIRLRGRSSDNIGVIEFRDNASTTTQAAISTYPTYLSILVPATERMRIDNAGLITGSGTSLGAWTAYTPTLGGTGWAIGNGTAEGYYCQIGKMVVFRVLITFGSTSTFGAASPATITLPVTAVGSKFVASHVLSGYFQDTSLTKGYQLHGRMTSTTVVQLSYLGTNGEVTGTSASSPFAWANTDLIAVSGTYEIA